MFSLQSDFLRHSLINLLGPAELRMYIRSHAQMFLNYSQYRPIDYTVLKQSSGPTPSDSLEERLGKAKSSDVAKCSHRFGLQLSCHHGFGDASIVMKNEFEGAFARN